MASPLILCGTDLTEASSPAAEFAALLAHAASARLLLVHVEAEDGPSPHPGDTAERLERQRAGCAARGIDCEALRSAGEPWEQLSRLAADRDAELVVVGAHGDGGRREVLGGTVREYLLGTTADRLVRYCGHPVLVVPSSADADSDLSGACWMVGVDFAEPGREALRVALRWSERTGGKPLLLHVIPPEGSPDIAASDQEFERKMQRRLGELAAEQAGDAEHRLWSAYGLASDGLCDAADQLGARVLVLGSQGRRAVPRFFLGSTAERCLRRVDRPTLVVGPPG